MVEGTSPSPVRRSRRSPSPGRRPATTDAAPEKSVVGYRTVHEKTPVTSAVIGYVVYAAVFASAYPTYLIGKRFLPPKGDSADPASPWYRPTADYILAAAPFFSLTLLLEMALGGGRLSVGGRFRLEDTVFSMTAGLFQTLARSVVPVTATLAIVPYNVLWQNYALVRLPADSWAVWIGAFMMVDMCYYWFHRGAHEINLAWAGHIVHHSSENMNFSTALRQGVLQELFSWPFFAVLALVLPPEVYFVNRVWNTLFQFSLHTTAIRRVPLLEPILNTPSHHRVHHDRRCPHCNYGGVLIIWDRLFGTFTDESDLDTSLPPVPDDDERVVYGILNSPGTWNPFVVQFRHLAHIVSRMRKAHGWRAKALVLWNGPGRRSLRRTHPPPVSQHIPRLRFTTEYGWGLGVYLLVHFVCVLLVSVLMLALYAQQQVSYVEMAVACSVAALTMGVLGSVMDGRSWARTVERQRAVAVAAALYYLATAGPNVVASPGVLHIVAVVVGAVHAVSAVATLLVPGMLHSQATLKTSL